MELFVVFAIVEKDANGNYEIVGWAFYDEDGNLVVFRTKEEAHMAAHAAEKAAEKGREDRPKS